jgi:ribosomal protein S18 acetylase RimI-like enzyme
MASIAKTLSTPLAAPQIRPFDAHKDLYAVADLIELGFAETLDEEGRRYLSQMRSAAKNYDNLGWFGLAGRFSGYAMGGYVWEEAGRVIGNLSILPQLVGARRYFLIANVVVHPEYRRRGIGRALTVQGVEHARNAAAPAVWLHVREENLGAITLYESLGFVTRARRTTWRLDAEAVGPEPDEAYLIRAPGTRDWDLQRAWLQKNYPKDLLWSQPLNLNLLRPGLFGAVLRFFNENQLVQLAVYSNGKLAGVISWQSGLPPNNLLWLAAPAQADSSALQALLRHTRRSLPSHRPPVLEYPAGQSDPDLLAAGFYKHQTLLWMENKF